MSVLRLVIGEKVLVRGDFGVVIGDGNEVAFVVEAIESVFLAADVVDEKDAVEVVNFVEKSAGEETFGFEADFLAVFEESFDFSLARATDATINLRNRETAFVISLDFALSADDFGVDEGGEMMIFFVVEVVTNDNDTLVDAELRGGHGGR